MATGGFRPFELDDALFEVVEAELGGAGGVAGVGLEALVLDSFVLLAGEEGADKLESE